MTCQWTSARFCSWPPQCLSNRAVNGGALVTERKALQRPSSMVSFSWRWPNYCCCGMPTNTCRCRTDTDSRCGFAFPAHNIPHGQHHYPTDYRINYGLRNSCSRGTTACSPNPPVLETAFSNYNQPPLWRVSDRVDLTEHEVICIIKGVAVTCSAQPTFPCYSCSGQIYALSNSIWHQVWAKALLCFAPQGFLQTQRRLLSSI